MVFVQGPAMKQQFSFAVEHKDAERAMEHALAVGFHFLHGAQGAIFWVHEDNFFRHELH